jgi:hypothetical protein
MMASGRCAARRTRGGRGPDESPDVVRRHRPRCAAHAELAHIRAVAPDARPAIYTNGDLLNGDVLDRMITAGVKWDHPLMRDWRIRHGAADWSASPACRNCVQALPETRK